ncbi:MAG TPA: RHS repeat-associated core domain-containing protein, partial [Gemmataceae bacterium]
TSALMPSGDTITYGYDKLYRQTGMDDTGDGQWANYAYDPAGYMTNISNSLSQTFDYGYDFAGRVTTVTNTTNGLNQTYTYTYNARNQVASVTNPLNQTTSYGYTILGQVSTVTDPRGGVTKYGYDLANDLLSLTDPNNNITTYAYNALHQVTSVTDPRNHTTTYDYHAGLLTQTTDRNNRTIDYGYDALNRLDSETWVGGNYTATYGYDTAGNLTVASDPFSTYTYGYNAANQLTSVDNAGTPSVPHVVLTYGYDTSNNRTSLTDSLGGIINYGYDSSRRLTSMGLSLNGTMAANLTFGYDVGSELTGITRTTPGGDTITSNFTYDGANRLTNITHSDATTGMTLASYTYGYNIGNQLTSYQDANSSLTYGYDPDGELTSASGTLAGSSFNATYSYDLNGNRNMPDYQTDPGNLLTNDGTYSYTYDNEGNTLTQTNIATGSVTYFTWDYRNRLTEEKQEDNQGHVLNDEMFTYDVNNNRIGTSVNGVQTWTVYDGSNPYMDFNGSGQLTERYLTNPNGLNQFYGQVNASGVTQWFLTDNLGSIRQVVDANGNPLYAVTYDPFGGNVSQTNPGNAPRFGYAGGEQDAILGIYHFNSRWYNPATGKWLSQDPLGLKPDSNPYRYVGNDPTNAIDPTGEADNRDPRYSEWYNKWLGPPGAYPSYPRLNRLTRGVDVYYPPPAGGAGSARMGPAGIASQVIESRRQQIGMTSGIRNVINQRFPGALNPSNGWQVVKRAKVWVRPLVLSGLTKGRQISITVNAKDAPIGSSVEVYFNGQRVPGDGKLGKGGTYDTKYKISINLPPLNPNMGRVNASDPPENNGYEIQAIIRPPGEGKEIIYGYARLPVYP